MSLCRVIASLAQYKCCGCYFLCRLLTTIKRNERHLVIDKYLQNWIIRSMIGNRHLLNFAEWAEKWLQRMFINLMVARPAGANGLDLFAKARRTWWNKTETKHWNCFSLISIFFNMRINTLCSEKNTHSHFLPYLYKWCVDLNKNCTEYT